MCNKNLFILFYGSQNNIMQRYQCNAITQNDAASFCLKVIQFGMLFTIFSWTNLGKCLVQLQRFLAALKCSNYQNWLQLPCSIFICSEFWKCGYFIAFKAIEQIFTSQRIEIESLMAFGVSPYFYYFWWHFAWSEETQKSISKFMIFYDIKYIRCYKITENDAGNITRCHSMADDSWQNIYEDYGISFIIIGMRHQL